MPNTLTSPPRFGLIRRPVALGAILLAFLMLGSMGFPVGSWSSPSPAQHPSPTGHSPSLTSSAIGGTPSTARLPSASFSGPVPLHPGAVAPLNYPGTGISNLLSLPRISSGGASSLSPLISSDSSNYVVAGGSTLAYSGGPVVTQAGGSNKSLVAGLFSYTYNGSGSTYPGYISGWLWSHGFSAASHSSNGGQAWTNNWVPANASWTTPGGPMSGNIGLGASSVVSTGGSSPTVYYAETVQEDCVALGYAAQIASNPTAYNTYWPAYCNSTQRAAAVGGIAIAKSTNGGASWNAPSLAVKSRMFWMNATGTPFATCGFGSYVQFGNGTFDPSLSFNSANNLLVLTWMNFSINLVQLACTTQGLMGFEFVNLTGMISVSANGGTTWSTPRVTGAPFGAFPYVNYMAGQQPSAAVGPAPTYTDYVVHEDLNNASIINSSGYKPIVSMPLAISTSTNNGTSWSAPTTIPNFAENYVNSSNPAQFGNQYFFNQSGPKIAVDNWTGSAYKGNVYLVWADNRTQSLPGTPSIAFSRSTDGASTWSTPVNLSLGDTGSHFYFEPAVSVGPTGEIWVTYLGLSLAPSGGLYTYRYYGVVSTDGGSTWSSQFAVADADSTQTQTTTGGAPAIVGTSNGAYALWPDCRGISCPGTNGALQRAVMAANVHAVPVNLVGPTSAPVTVSTLGSTSSASATVPGIFGFEPNAQVTVTVPQTLPDSATYVWSFQSFTGIGAAATTTTTFTYAGAGSLTANYLPVRAGWITGTIGPVTGPYAASVLVSINGIAVSSFTPFNGSAESFNVTEAGASTYSLVASETAYTMASYPVGVAAGSATHKDIWLSRLSGYLNGTVTPHSATLQINGSAVAVDAGTGIFSDHLSWGNYLVNASAPGFPSFSRMVTVIFGTTTPLIVSLAYGWINGTISPGAGHISINNASVAVLPTGSFAQNLSGGSYYVVGTLAGYSWYHSLVQLAPGTSVRLTISLTNRGWLNGTAGPAAALAGSLVVTVDGRTVNVGVTGQFTSSVVAGKHVLVAGAPGYYTQTKNYTVTAGNNTNGSFTLVKIPPPTCTTNCPGQGNNNSGGLSSGTVLLYVGLGAVAAVVAGLLAVMLIRRRRANEGGGKGSEPQEPQPYPEEPPADSATGPNPPPGGS